LYIGVFGILFTCKTTNYQKLDLTLKASSESFAVYAIQENDFSSVLPKGIAKAGIRIEGDIDLTKYLALISFKKSLLSSEGWEVLFTDLELKEFKDLLSTAITHQSANGYLVLIKKEDPLSPSLKILRSSFLIMKTDGGYIFAIPDLNQNLTFSTQYKFDDWALYQIPKISSSKKQEIKIKPNQIQFSIYKEQVEESMRYYDRILVIDDKKYLPDPNIFKTPDLDDLPLQKQNKTVLERLRSLEELKVNGMISEEEYKNKKAEILKEL